eukprot:TRINITY_DN67544_c3_g2_i1.p1 TRINITY_DN67544_c3_g2~~TRINITY_DN67544_c3_g2_i1.p1  ORF type:complete len:206 (-),score=23.72 TRINITY_DN67544_c3_g2_i1:565-1182(-)
MRTVIALAFLVELASCFFFDLEATSYKCLAEELPESYNVVGSFEALPGYSQIINVRVTDPDGKLIQEEKGVDKGEFNFVTSRSGDHNFCFYNRLVPGVRYTQGLRRRIDFQLATGNQAVDYEEVATKEHLKPVEVNLRIMEDTVKQIHTEYFYFKSREAEMRETNDATNSRALWITLINVAVFFAFASWQVLHLKRFFIQKKLIS